MFILTVQVRHTSVLATKLSMAYGIQLLAVMALYQQLVRALVTIIQEKYHQTYVIIIKPTNTQILVHVLRPLVQ
jgi:hypothetical protein